MGVLGLRGLGLSVPGLGLSGHALEVGMLVLDFRWTLCQTTGQELCCCRSVSDFRLIFARRRHMSCADVHALRASEVWQSEMSSWAGFRD